MASTLSNSTLTVTVTESLTLNGSNHGSTKKMTIAGVNEVSKRIITTLTDGTQIYKGHATVASFGQFIYGNVKYIRITNLDDTNPVTIHIEDTNNTTYAQFLIPAGHVFFLTDAAGSYGDASSPTTPTGNIERIDAVASSAAVDVEILVASA
tara:strand:+ start:981 stop:1436 length:456 start_codon:yes stop_codon:yes gene_type:complete